MPRRQLPLVLTLFVFTCAVALGYAEAPPQRMKGNAYFLYTKALAVSDSGVVAVPARFKWSIESSQSGLDVQGKHVPDSRIMMRLYDPSHNFTAMTAQMDLHTAEKLQRALADLIAKKRQDPNYQHRPKLYPSSMIPLSEIKGVSETGELIIKLHPRAAK